MMNTLINLTDREVKESRQIKSTSKRQITIPKSFFQILAIQDRATFEAQVIGDGVFLRPIKEVPLCIRDQDREKIIRQVISDGYNGEDLVNELNHRLKEYDDFLYSRVQEFERDIMNNIEGLDVEPGDDSYNGLDVLFDQEIGEVVEEP